MKRIFVIGLLLSASLTFAQTIPELFGKAKEEIKAGSWADASKTLDALEAEAGKPATKACASSSTRRSRSTAESVTRISGSRTRLSPLSARSSSCSPAPRSTRRSTRRKPWPTSRRRRKSRGGANGLARRRLQTIHASADLRDRGPVLGRRPGPLDHDGRRDEDVGLPDRPERASRLRREVLGRARGASGRGWKNVPGRNSSAGRRSRIRTSRRTPRSAAA